MDKQIVFYLRCGLCGLVLPTTDESFNERTQRELTTMPPADVSVLRTHGLSAYKEWVQNFTAQHSCSDGGFGLATFAGVKIENVSTGQWA
jgi:hypothetical protein